MRKLLILLMISALVGCATGDKISRLRNGMVEGRATNIMGEPDWVENRGEYVVLRYDDRLVEYYPSYARANYYVIVKNGLVIDFGIGEIRSELPPPADQCNAWLGTIGVVPALFLPEAEVDTPGGWKENLSGANQAMMQVPALGFWPFDLAAFSIAACAGWSDAAARGRKLAVPDNEVEDMRALITRAIPELKIQQTLSAYVSQTLLNLTDCGLDLLQGEGPHYPDEELNYGFLKGDGIDYVLEVSVSRLGFRSSRGGNPDIFFIMTVHTRFLRAGEEEEIFSKDFFWQSDESLKLVDYVDNDARLLREEFDRACREASEKISQRVLSSDFCPEI